MGNPAHVERATRSGFVLMGGGKDVDEAFRWLIERSGGGDIVVLRASGTAAYNPYIHRLGAVDSVETIILRDRSASSDPALLAKVHRAEALWIAGGDQWNYVRLWKDTPLMREIQWLIDHKRPVGGTSAGLAILADYYFSAEHDTIQSPEALADPFSPRLTLGKNFLRIPGLERTITDSHFSQRNRFGRATAFLARMQRESGQTKVRAIGVDEATALLVDENGAAIVVGRNVVQVIETTELPVVCEPGRPLDVRNLRVTRLVAGDKIRLGWR